MPRPKPYAGNTYASSPTPPVRSSSIRPSSDTPSKGLPSAPPSCIDAAYKAYRTGDVSRTREYLTELDTLPYHDEDLRPKALLLTALTEVQAGQEAQLRKRLEDFVQRYPETR